MNTGGESAEQLVRMSLNGVEVAAKITGAGAKQLAVLLYTILKEQNKTKGASRLSSMLRSGKELKVFTVKQSELKTFVKEAKRYGVLYCALRGRKKNPDGLVDIMVRAEDASKINRIVERFELAAVDKASIKNEIVKDKEKKSIKKPQDPIVDGLTPEESKKAESFLDDLMGDTKNEVLTAREKREAQTKGEKERKNGQSRLGERKGQTNAPLSEPILKKPRNFDKTSMDDRNGERRSVRKELAEIYRSREQAVKQQRAEPEKGSGQKSKQKVVAHAQPLSKKRRGKEKER